MAVQLLSVTEAAAQMRAGGISSRELVEQCLARIDRYEHDVRAWVLVDAAGARRAAEMMDDESARGQWRGPLHGIPLGIKDLIDVAGFPTQAGSPLRADHRATADAPLVAALRQSGAIILGKTVTVEFACFDPSPTRNPWNLRHTPGGSSSGSAAAVAMGMCPAAMGTQTGGSLVRPSSYCGVATCKPTFGLIDTEGVVPVSEHLDHPGPIARTVDDLELLLRCLVPSLPKSPEQTRPPRLGLVDGFFMERADGVVRAATEAAVARLAEHGAAVERVRLAVDFEKILDLHWRIMAVDAAAYHRASFAAHRQGYGPMITRLLDEGLATAAVDYAAALARQRHLRRAVGQWFEGFDVLLAPSTDTTAPPRLDTTGARTFQSPWSYAGVPVVSIPCGLGTDGMPAAVQLVGRPHDDARLLQVARWCQQAIDFRQSPPSLNQ